LIVKGENNQIFFNSKNSVTGHKIPIGGLEPLKALDISMAKAFSFCIGLEDLLRKIKIPVPISSKIPIGKLLLMYYSFFAIFSHPIQLS